MRWAGDIRGVGRPGRLDRRISIDTLDVNNAQRYYFVMIVSFGEVQTERFAQGWRVKRFAGIESVARRKLRQLQIAGRLADLRVPPGNRLAALRGDRAGQHSIRVDDQYRVCFRRTAAGTEDVEIADSHSR
jgi:toxin HigB-1